MRSHGNWLWLILGLFACSSGTVPTSVDAGGPGVGGSVDAGFFDAGSRDAGTVDAGTDAGTDAGMTDAGMDAGLADAGMDAGITDAGITDAGTTDAGTADAGHQDAGTTVYCAQPADCTSGSFCAADGTCQAGSCSSGHECISGYSCSGSGTCESSTPNGCSSDNDCTLGDRCLAEPGQGGVCVSPSGQCIYGVQCADITDHCVDGACVTACTSNADCRDGFGCDMAIGACTTVLKQCHITADCGSATLVCVNGACVPRSVNGACSNSGDVPDQNGCVPAQTPKTQCDPSQSGTQGSCQTGSICLLSSCWISCDAPNQNACQGQSMLNMCTPITDTSGTFNVCLPSGAGTECAPGMSCSSGSCVDGTCK